MAMLQFREANSIKLFIKCLAYYLVILPTFSVRTNFSKEKQQQKRAKT